MAAKDTTGNTTRIQKHIDWLQGRIDELAQYRPANAGPEFMSDELLQDLHTSLEELLVADEELRQQQTTLLEQNQELNASRRAIERERERYRELFEFAPDGYVITSPDGTIREANRAAAQLFRVHQD